MPLVRNLMKLQPKLQSHLATRKTVNNNEGKTDTGFPALRSSSPDFKDHSL